MDPDKLAPASALTTALLPAAASAEALAVARPAVTNPAELLASLMDFPGSVALAELLDDAPAPRDEKRLPARSAAGERLLFDAEARLESLERAVLKPLLGRRAPGLPSTAELLDSLQRYGIDRDRSEQAVERFADSLGFPFRSALGLSFRQAQAHVSTLRWELTHDLRALGPRADQLERLDAALSRSMQAKLGELMDRMEYAAHLTFIRACVHAVEGLPDAIDEASLRAWCDEHGWIARYRERCVRMAKALFGHLRRSLIGLVRAASMTEDS